MPLKSRTDSSQIVIKHHGAVTGVTGSCHQLFWSPHQSILIDCGLFQGAEITGAADAINFSLQGITALVVTHVHIDHVGRIPALLAAGFDGPIYCSYPTSLLLPEVLEDAMKIGVTRNKSVINRVLKELKKQLRPLPYLKWQPIAEQGDYRLNIKLHNAGHILGAAYVSCQLHSAQWSNGRHCVVFSGDLGAPYSPLLKAPVPPYGCDTLVLESTYGDRLHGSRRDRGLRLAEAL